MINFEFLFFLCTFVKNMSMNQLVFDGFPNIVADVEYCDGQPRIKNTRITVTALLSYIAGGMSIDDLLIEFPSLTREDILQVLTFAANQLQVRYVPLKSNAA